jgi:hypothetical protein
MVGDGFVEVNHRACRSAPTIAAGQLAGIRGDDENNAGSALTALDALEMATAAGLTVVSRQK